MLIHFYNFWVNDLVPFVRLLWLLLSPFFLCFSIYAFYRAYMIAIKTEKELVKYLKIRETKVPNPHPFGSVHRSI